jgi:hypothetical protein
MARPPRRLFPGFAVTFGRESKFFTTLKSMYVSAKPTSLHADEVRGMRPFLHVPARPLPSTDKTRPSLAHARS